MFGIPAKHWNLPAVLATVAMVAGSWAPSRAQAIPDSQQTGSPAPAQQQPTAEDMADSLNARQHYQAAIAAYNKIEPKTAAIWNKMGIAYQMMFNNNDALRCYRESLKLEPRNTQVLNNLGTVYASLKDYPQADKIYKKALKIDPRSALVLKNLGTNLLAEHKYDRGWTAYQQALAIDPQIFADRASLRIENPASVHERGAMNYYMAAGCARSGHTDCALQYLRMALNEGFTDRKKIAVDVEFASLRSDPDFKQLLAEPSAQ